MTNKEMKLGLLNEVVTKVEALEVKKFKCIGGTYEQGLVHAEESIMQGIGDMITTIEKMEE